MYYRLKGDNRGVFGVLVDKQRYLEALQLLESLDNADVTHCLGDTIETLILHTANRVLALLIDRNLQHCLLTRIVLAASINEELISAKDRVALMEFMWNEVTSGLEKDLSLHPAIVNTCLSYMIKYEDYRHREDKMTQLLFALFASYPMFEISESVETAMEAFGHHRLRPWLQLFRGEYAGAVEDMLLAKDPHGPGVLRMITTHALIDDDKKTECQKCIMSLRHLSLIDPSVKLDFSFDHLSHILDSDSFKNYLFQACDADSFIYSFHFPQRIC